ncbi:MAG TPA: archease [Candidatus Nanoarchaeia archaeon]|nr:archease [Candidatus Nanoarchaeia archaeon]
MKHYKLLPDIAVADIAYEAYGKSLKDVFEHAAEAIMDMLGDRKKIQATKKFTIKLKNINLENLLFDFLNEIVFLKDSEYSVFKTVKVTIKEGKENKLIAVLTGEKINPEKHELGNDVKAVTMHQYKLEKKGKQWVARVVVDI